MTGAPAGVVRGAATVLLALLLAALSGGPAWAHGAGGADVSNYASEVSGLADGVAEDGTPGPAVPAVDGLTWRVVANDALLEVRNTTGRELVVSGYEGEPYLRIGDDGVFENRRSPAVHLNTDRYGDATVPADADPRATPEWVHVGDGPVHAWHDHRIHWMAATEPPQVKVDPGAPHDLFDWAVPFRLGDRDLAVAGALRWVPGPPAWPWVAAAAAVLLVPVAIPAVRGRSRGEILRAAATVVAAVAIVDVVHAVDDLLSVPATAAQIAGEAARVAVPVAVAAVAAWRGARADGLAVASLAVGAVALLVGLGLPDVAVLSASQLAGALPAAVSRLAVAANLAVVLPVGLAALLARRPDAAEPEPAAAAEPTRVSR